MELPLIVVVEEDGVEEEDKDVAAVGGVSRETHGGSGIDIEAFEAEPAREVSGYRG